MHRKQPFREFPGLFANSRDGAVAIIVAIVLPLLIGVALGVLDFSRLSSNRQILQDSLDAAALFAARSEATTDAELQAAGMQAMSANLLNMRDGTLVSATFKSGGEGGQKVVATATGTIQTTILGLIGRSSLDFSTSTEVTRSSKDIEVALVLDTTGSMAGQNIADMKTAAGELIDIVVRDAQTPFYSKVALVPYSMAVNVGSYAAQVRGAITPAKAITAVSKPTGNKNAEVTSTAHGFADGSSVYITGVNGMTQLNGNVYTVVNKTANTFELSDTKGMSGFNNYTSGGVASCYTQGCEYYRFTSASNKTRTFKATTCVTERTGAQAYTDAAPSTVFLGRNYRSDTCLQNTITPLSSDKGSLKTSLSVLQAEGSTGGHIGVAWGWYMVSPNFGYLFSGEGVPAAYTRPDLIKAVVIMTDGEYNSVYCNGVISKDSTTGSGSSDDHESCDAPNGSAYYQAGELCKKMKAAGVIVYTVGFKVINTQAAKDLVNGCATDAAHVYLPATGADLKTAFQAIGQDLSKLRLSR